MSDDYPPVCPPWYPEKEPPMTAPETPKLSDRVMIVSIQRAGGIGYAAATRVADLFAALRARVAELEAALKVALGGKL